MSLLTPTIGLLIGPSPPAELRISVVLVGARLQKAFTLSLLALKTEALLSEVQSFYPQDRVSKTCMQPPHNLKPDPILVSPAPPLHQSNADEDDENVKQLQECSSIYLSLQTCLINNNRNWKSCQMEVQALKACNQKRMKNDKRK